MHEYQRAIDFIRGLDVQTKIALLLAAYYNVTLCYLRTLSESQKVISAALRDDLNSLPHKVQILASIDTHLRLHPRDSIEDIYSRMNNR